MLNTLRLRKGLFWSKSYPTLADLKVFFNTLGFILFVLAAMAFAQFVTAYGDAVADRIAAEAMLTDCLNGKPVGSFDNGSRYGFGKTYVSCKVQEVEV